MYHASPIPIVLAAEDGTARLWPGRFNLPSIFPQA